MLLRAENISKTFFRSSGSANYFYAVSPLSLEISPGTVTVLMGRSGSGKSYRINKIFFLIAGKRNNVVDIDLRFKCVCFPNTKQVHDVIASEECVKIRNVRIIDRKIQRRKEK